MGYKILFLIAIQIFLCFTKLTSQIDLFLPFNATFNVADFSGGTVTLDITAQNQNIPINSMTLHNFDVGSANTATISARIYSVTAQLTNTALVLAQNTTTVNVHNADITIPISFTLVNGVIYRLGFYMESQNADHFFKTAQTTASYYYDSNGLIKINQNESFSSQFDVFPSTGLSPLPYISLGLNTTAIKENTLLTAVNGLSPNPANELICVNFTKRLPYIKLDLLDLSGKLLNTQEFYNTNNPSFDVLGLEKGFYFLRITTKEEGRTLKFIKS